MPEEAGQGDGEKQFAGEHEAGNCWGQAGLPLPTPPLFPLDLLAFYGNDPF